MHIAARNGCVNNLIALLYEGNANVTVINHRKQTPLHRAKSSKILDILLMKTNSENFANLEMKNNVEIPLFDYILDYHPTSMKTYLDMMVTSKNLDSDSHDQHLVFDLSMFKHNTSEKHNYLDKHLELIKSGFEDMLKHPLMRLFISLNWQPHKYRYQMNFFIYVVFLLIFTAHGLISIDFLQCDKYIEEDENITKM